MTMLPFPESSQWCNLQRMGSPAGPRTNGAMNNLLLADAPAHGWYRFVLSFPPHLVRSYAERFGLDESSGPAGSVLRDGHHRRRGEEVGDPESWRRGSPYGAPGCRNEGGLES